MVFQVQRIVALSSLFLVATSAFSARKASQLVRNPSSSSLRAGAVIMDDDEMDSSVFLMSQATACANSETCSLEEAQSYLDDVLSVQKDCLSGAVAAGNNALCENVDAVVEVVANLRQKIQTEQRKVAPVKASVHLVNLVMGVYVVNTILHGFSAVPDVPFEAPIFDSVQTFGEANSRGVATILPQEWFWAFRDGYLPQLFSEWMKNGGLVVDVSAFDEKVVAFAPREWVWSIQNGSFGNLLEENMRYGGYRVDAGFDTEGMTPLNGQDLLWSIRDGYFGTAANHFFRNGGV